MSTRRDELPVDRLKALSDGVFAIAITLLVLELAVEPDAADHPLPAILEEWPSYLAYVTSFLTIGVVWIAHSTITGQLRAADSTLYRLNLLVLLLASFLPFPTKLVGDFVDEERAERVAVVSYGLALLALVISLTFLLRYAVEQRHLLHERIDEEAAAAARLSAELPLLCDRDRRRSSAADRRSRPVPCDRPLSRRARSHDSATRAAEVGQAELGVLEHGIGNHRHGARTTEYLTAAKSRFRPSSSSFSSSRRGRSGAPPPSVTGAM